MGAEPRPRPVGDLQPIEGDPATDPLVDTTGYREIGQQGRLRARPAGG